MSTIYKHLSKEEAGLERKHPALIAPEISSTPSFLGLKFAVFFAFILSIAAIGGGVYLFMTLKSERAERQELEASQVQFRERAQSLELESDQYRAEIARLRDQVKAVSDQRDSQKNQLDSNNKLMTELQSKIRQLEVKSNELERKAVSLQSQAPLPAAGLAAASSPAAASPASLTPAASETPQASETVVKKTSQVMTVNRKFNFVVINLGLRDDLKMGQDLIVEHNGKEIGQVQVEKLYDNFAAATIVQEKKDGSIREGDLVYKA